MSDNLKVAALAETARLREERDRLERIADDLQETCDSQALQLSAAIAACAMKDEVLRTFDGSFARTQWDETYPPSRGWDNKRINALSATPKQVSEWERKQLEPLMLRIAELEAQINK